MRINRAAIKLHSKELMRTVTPKPILVALVYLIVIWVLNYLAQSVTGNLENAQRAMDAILNNESSFSPASTGVAGWFISLAIQIMVIILGVGFSLYALRVSRRQTASYGNLFDGFGFFFKALGLNIAIGLLVALAAILLVIPGIILSYGYRQAVFLLIDDPQRSIGECMRESRRMMRGHKMELFVLDLSFIGWSLLCVIPFVSVYVDPYIQITYANYYNALLGIPQPDRTDWGGQRHDNDQAPPWER